MDENEITSAVEAILFAAGEPLTLRDLKRVFERHWRGEPEEERQRLLDAVAPAIAALQARWPEESDEERRGFALVEVAGGYTFRSHADYKDLIQAMREQRPVRLSKAALEALAIVAYRQPVTKAEVDFVRGVDCGGTLRILLDRGLLKIVGKKEEPGRPLLYGTTREFLSLFSLRSLKDLPSLQEYQELTDDSAAVLQDFDISTAAGALQDTADKFSGKDEPAVDALDEALASLDETEKTAQEALAAKGIQVEPEPEPESAPNGD